MQLILDGDTDINIKINMSTIEGESLSEKFLTNKNIEHLADNISNGNKENIQKQDNILPDQELKDGLLETDKEISTVNDLIETNGENLVEGKKVSSVDETAINAAATTEGVKNVKNIKEAKNGVENVGNVPIRSENVENINQEAVISENEVNIENVENNLEPEIGEIISNKSDADVNKIINSKIINSLDEKESQNKDESSSLKIDNESDCFKKIECENETDIKFQSNAAVTQSPNVVIEEKINNPNDVIQVEPTLKTEDLETKSDQSKVPINLENKETDMDSAVGNSVESITKSVPIEIVDEDEKIEEIVEPNPEISTSNIENMDEKHLEVQNTDIIKSPQIVAIISNEPEALPRFCKLSNNLDIFSDDEEDPPEEEPAINETSSETVKQCIDIDDDDDIMLIDEDLNAKDSNIEAVSTIQEERIDNSEEPLGTPVPSKEYAKEKIQLEEIKDDVSPVEKDTSTIVLTKQTDEADGENNMPIDKPQEPDKVVKPLLPSNFIKTCKKNLAEMTRDDLEEFCILKIVESIVDRSNLGEIKAHLKTLSQHMEEYKNKIYVLTKQNQDLEIVLQSVQAEVKNRGDAPITPLKITRSVGMQVILIDHKGTVGRKKTSPGTLATPNNSSTNNSNNKQVKSQPHSNIRNQKISNQQIPVPRLVPANSPAAKTNSLSQITIHPSLHNGVKNSPPALKTTEKRSRAPSATVDLTDDEPPAKLQSRGAAKGLRVLPTPTLLAPQRPTFNQNVNSPRKVYIPISGPPGQSVRPGQTIMLRAVGAAPGSRPRLPPHLTKVSPNASGVRLGRMQTLRHPGPLPEALKQYQPANWKIVPPAPDIKLAKVENGIVISWKIEGFMADNFEEIASFQLYAYQESTLPPSSTLWKKIGDVKALPLPMACTLTQFMPGYKYYFAVRAVDVKSRFGPFSAPASILLLNSN